jgi:hypothetical protein
MLKVNANLSMEQVDAQLRKAADMIAEANMLIQTAFESSEELYELCSELDNLAENIEAQADSLAVEAVWSDWE